MTVQNWKSLLVGFVVSVGTALIMLSIAFTSNDLFTTILMMVLTALNIAFVGYGGLIEIPVVHLGVATFLGRRVSFLTFSEGWHWLPPRPFADMILISVQRRRTDINKKEFVAKDNVKIFVDEGVLWEVSNPHHYLSFEESADSGLESVLKDLMVSETRDEMLLYRSKKATQEKNTLKKRLQGAVEEAATAQNWGIRIVDTYVTQVELSPELKRAFERKSEEERQREAEVVEREHVIKSVKRIAKELNISELEANKIFQSERGKMTRNEQIVTVSDLDKLTRSVLDRFGNKEGTS